VDSAGLSGDVVCESEGRTEDVRLVERVRGRLKRARRDIVVVVIASQ
jgi:hypothetical protein